MFKIFDETFELLLGLGVQLHSLRTISRDDGIKGRAVCSVHSLHTINTRGPPKVEHDWTWRLGYKQTIPGAVLDCYNHSKIKKKYVHMYISVFVLSGMGLIGLGRVLAQRLDTMNEQCCVDWNLCCLYRHLIFIR